MKLKTLTLFSACIALSQTAVAQDAKATDKAESVVEKSTLSNGQKIANIIAVENAKYEALTTKMRAMKDRKAAKEFFRRENTGRQAPALKIYELALASPKDKQVVAGIIWGLRSYNSDQKKAVMKLIIQHHLDSSYLSDLVSSLGRIGKQSEAHLQDMMLYAKEEKVRQAAAIYLANIWVESPQKKAQGVALYEQLVAWPGIKKSNPRLYKSTKISLFKATQLSIGSKVPDIIGTDHDGVEFKLSDYKGKVVLLDFWGIW